MGKRLLCGVNRGEEGLAGLFRLWLAGGRMKTEEKKSSLSRELLGIITGSAAVSLFFFGFLRMTAGSIAGRFLYETGVELSEYESQTLELWITGLAFAAAAVLFVVTALVLMGKKISYVNEIMAGVEALRQKNFEGEVRLEGSNELTELASSINCLAETERELRERENMLSEAKRQLIRSISHDIRTPLTSIISYTDLIKNREDLTAEELHGYFELVSSKSEQIRWLSERLLDEDRRQYEHVSDGRLLFEQLLMEWESVLEDEFELETDTSQLGDFSGELVIGDIRRVFDNLASNVAKYADRAHPVRISVEASGGDLEIRQSNHVRKRDESSADSRGIGLLSIDRIARDTGGEIEVTCDDEVFIISISMKI